MLPMPRSAVVAAASVAAGAALYGAAAGGVVAIDDDLRAVTPPARFETVELRRVVERRSGQSVDCPALRRRAAPAPSPTGEV